MVSAQFLFSLPIQGEAGRQRDSWQLRHTSVYRGRLEICQPTLGPAALMLQGCPWDTDGTLQVAAASDYLCDSEMVPLTAPLNTREYVSQSASVERGQGTHRRASGVKQRRGKGHASGQPRHVTQLNYRLMDRAPHPLLQVQRHSDRFREVKSLCPSSDTEAGKTRIQTQGLLIPKPHSAAVLLAFQWSSISASNV